jgi:hypothetical protein
MRQLIGAIIGAAIGGILGYTQVLCPGGTCAITGSWYGGALFGGMFGLFISGGCPLCSTSSCNIDNSGKDDDSKAQVRSSDET